MALTLTSIANSLVQQNRIAQSQASSQSDPVAQAFSKSGQRISQAIDSTKVQLSSYGQLKSSFADVQAAGNALGDTKKPATPADVKKGVQAFVDAYNKANQEVANATRGQGSKPGALANEGRAVVAGSELRQSATAGSNLTELRKLGVTVASNGNLKIDTKVLDQALAANADQVRTSVARVGSQVAQAASRQLADTGSLGGAVNSLTKRTANLEAQQSQQEAAAAALQQVQQAGQTVYAANGLAAYVKLMSG